MESNGICTYCILEGIFKVNLIYVLLGQEDLLEKGQATHSSILGLLLWLRLPTPVFLGFSCDSAGKESSCDSGDLGSIPGSGKSPGEGTGYPFQYSGMESSMDWIVHGVAKTRT